ncbi:MAG TPA: NAD(P)-binding domain-containing protein, partial [Pyrinomonadaceae bacterium]|nr:NAD(P)-binding domain-containing protein [Pyrinomonadaceae bacterium]
MRTETSRSATVNVVGAGRLGTALARALSRAGYDVRAVVSRDPRHARRAARLVGTKPKALPSSRLGQLPEADLIIIAVPDDALPPVAEALAAAFSSEEKVAGKTTRTRRTRVALHASG